MDEEQLRLSAFRRVMDTWNQKEFGNLQDRHRLFVAGVDHAQFAVRQDATDEGVIVLVTHGQVTHEIVQFVFSDVFFDFNLEVQLAEESLQIF